MQWGGEGEGRGGRGGDGWVRIGANWEASREGPQSMGALATNGSVWGRWIWGEAKHWSWLGGFSVT